MVMLWMSEVMALLMWSNSAMRMLLRVSQCSLTSSASFFCGEDEGRGRRGGGEGGGEGWRRGGGEGGGEGVERGVERGWRGGGEGVEGGWRGRV